MEYTELNFIIKSCNELKSEILSAKLNEFGYEGFVETDSGFLAYIDTNEFNKKSVDIIIKQLHKEKIEASYVITAIPEKNWNEEWEKSFNYVIINNECLIKTPLHKDTPKTKYEILIEPKMSFGTGHHETTCLMIAEMLEMDFSNKSVLDMGCGTGVLSILASKLEAKKILAIDYDNWAYENTCENIILNQSKNIKPKFGTSDLLGKEKFDIILANISKNTIIINVEKFASILTNNGIILCSGFYFQDLDDIQNEFLKYNIRLKKYKTNNNWTVAVFLNNI